MSVVFGVCRLCPKNSKPVRMYGDGVCSYHLRNPGKDDSKTVLEKEVLQSKIDEKLLKDWYNKQLAQVPDRCENCGGPFTKPAKVSPKCFVAHIVEKKNFRSVMVHPLNRWFACYDCHNKYDKEGWRSAVLMPVWPVCVERFREFMGNISPAELKFLPVQLALIHATILKT